MPKITRKQMKMFGSNAGLNQLAQFGSLAAAAPVFVNDGDPDTIQGIPAWESGWYGAVVGGNSPAIQDMNALQYVFAYMLSYIFQAGIPEWNTDTTYYIGSLATDSNGNIYKSKTDDNQGNALTNLTHWQAAVTDATPPVGSIVAYNPGYYTNGSNAGFTVTGPAGNTIAQVNAFLPANWRVCDGAALNDSDSPIWNAAGRYLPNLTDNRFLLGFTASGTTGGSNTSSLVEANLPAHVHTINHDHGSFTSGNNSVSHTHTINHDHGSFNSGVQSVSHNHPPLGGSGNYLLDNNASGPVAAAAASGADIAIKLGSTTSAVISANHTHVVDVPNYTGSSGNNSVSHTHSIDVPNYTGNSGSVGSGSSFNTIPKYLSTFFIVRVK